MTDEEQVYWNMLPVVRSPYRTCIECRHYNIHDEDMNKKDRHCDRGHWATLVGTQEWDRLIELATRCPDYVTP